MYLSAGFLKTKFKMHNKIARQLVLGIAGLVCGLGPSLVAQEINTQKVGFFAFDAPKYPAEVYVRTKEAYAKASLAGAATTSPMEVVNPDGIIRLYGEPTLNDEGEPVYPVIGEVKANAKWKEVFVVLNGIIKNDKPRWAGIAFPLTTNDFPDGSIKFVNLSDRPIRGIMGKGKFGIRPGAFETLRFQDPKGSVIGVVFHYQKKGEKKWSRMISTKWVVPDEGRKLLFAFQNPKTGTMMTKTLPIRK